MPDEVQDVFGFALSLAQEGSKHSQAKTDEGFLRSRSVGGR